MSLDYRVIEIYTSEEAKHGKRPVAEGVVDLVKSLKAAARCVAVVGRSGAYESGEISSKSLLTISYNLPVKIEIILPATELEGVLSRLETIVEDGIVAVREVSVRSYRTRHRLLPRQIRIRDIMTRHPVTVTRTSPLDEVAGVLLSAVFGGVPVVDALGRPEGIITQGDLIYKAGMPLRIGLVAASDPEQRSRIVGRLATKSAEAVMTPSPICIEESRGVDEAADKMIRHRLKRLPVVDDKGRLAGMISRVDIFQTIAREAPDWSALARRKVAVDRLQYVSDIMRRDTQTVGPETPVDEVIRVITADDIQRVAVVDGAGGFLGMISDRNLLDAFSGRGLGFWEYLACRWRAQDTRGCRGELRKTLEEKTASDVMETALVIVGESTPIEDAIGLMIDKRLKRLPVVDAEGRFRGMISRDALLKTGYRNPRS
ncbi:MAG: DUF190 domain-containing protein [Desulfobacterales bacterium]|jgi:CBS domain-containing protein